MALSAAYGDPPAQAGSGVYVVQPDDSGGYQYMSNSLQQADQADDDACTRGEAWSDLLSCLTSPLLRLGFLIQFLSLVFGFVFYYGYGGTGVFTFDLFSLTENLRNNDLFSAVMIILEIAFLIGSICISAFQIYLDDNSKLSRGFRTGSKLLGTAAMLDTIVIGFRLMQSIYAYQFLGVRWWLKYAQSNTDWCILYSATFIHSIALCLYGLGIFYMEAFHDEGTYEECSWAIMSIYSLAGFFELILCFTGIGNFYSIFQTLGLLIATVWAFSFEPLLHYYAPVFHDRNLQKDIMTQAEDVKL